MDYGFFHVATHRPGAFMYNEPLRDNQVQVYDDGTKYIYEVEPENFERFRDWVEKIFANYGEKPLSVSTDKRTIWVED